MVKAKISYFRTSAFCLMIDDLALRAHAALARTLASVRRRAREVLRTLTVTVTLVTTPSQG